MKISRNLCLSISILAFMSLFVGAKASHAATFYVATNGNDANAGTAAAPFRTLLKGVQTLRSGDMLIVKGGTYAEGLANIPSGSAGAPTTIQAAPGETVIVAPNNGNIDCVVLFRGAQSYVTIDGLILDAGGLSAYNVCNDDVINPSHLTIKNTEIKNSRNSGLLIGGGQWELRNNHIHHNAGGQPNPPFSHGVYFHAHHSLVIGNRIHDNNCWGLQDFSSAGANPTDNTYLQNTIYNQGCGALYLEQGVNHIAANNIFYNAPSGNPDGAALVCCGDNSKIYNNTIYGSSGQGIAVPHGHDVGAQVRNNIVYNNAAGNISVVNATVSNNLTTNPGFVDAAQGNFHLAAGSAAINAGVTLSQVEVDYDNVPRPQGAGYDIGAYEYRTSSGPAPVPAPRNLHAVSQP